MCTYSARLNLVSFVSSHSLDDDFIGYATSGPQVRATLCGGFPCGALDMVQLGFDRRFYTPWTNCHRRPHVPWIVYPVWRDVGVLDITNLRGTFSQTYAPVHGLVYSLPMPRAPSLP